jgi:hypothetical protein
MLFRKVDGEFFVQSILALLTGNRTNDEISDELIEHMGLDQIQCASEILDNRVSAIRQVRYALQYYGSNTY